MFRAKDFTRQGIGSCKKRSQEALPLNLVEDLIAAHDTALNATNLHIGRRRRCWMSPGIKYLG